MCVDVKGRYQKCPEELFKLRSIDNLPCILQGSFGDFSSIGKIQDAKWEGLENFTYTAESLYLSVIHSDSPKYCLMYSITSTKHRPPRQCGLHGAWPQKYLELSKGPLRSKQNGLVAKMEQDRNRTAKNPSLLLIRRHARSHV